MMNILLLNGGLIKEKMSMVNDELSVHSRRMNNDLRRKVSCLKSVNHKDLIDIIGITRYNFYGWMNKEYDLSIRKLELLNDYITRITREI